MTRAMIDPEGMLPADPTGAAINPIGAVPILFEDHHGDSVPNSIEQLNSFLRGEISAAETYKMAMDKVSNADSASTANFGLLREIQEEHGRASQAIRDRIRELSGEPADSSGAWGVWAKSVQGVADLFGDSAALKSLKEGEEHGLKDYEDGLERVDSVSADLIRNQFIPAQRRHINLLDQMMNASA